MKTIYAALPLALVAVASHTHSMGGNGNSIVARHEGGADFIGDTQKDYFLGGGVQGDELGDTRKGDLFLGGGRTGYFLGDTANKHHVSRDGQPHWDDDWDDDDVVVPIISIPEQSSPAGHDVNDDHDDYHNKPAHSQPYDRDEYSQQYHAAPAQYAPPEPKPEPTCDHKDHTVVVTVTETLTHVHTSCAQPATYGHPQPTTYGHPQPSTYGHSQPSTYGHSEPSTHRQPEPHPTGHPQTYSPPNPQPQAYPKPNPQPEGPKGQPQTYSQPHPQGQPQTYQPPHAEPTTARQPGHPQPSSYGHSQPPATSSHPHPVSSPQATKPATYVAPKPPTHPTTTSAPTPKFTGFTGGAQSSRVPSGTGIVVTFVAALSGALAFIL